MINAAPGPANFDPTVWMEGVGDYYDLCTEGACSNIRERASGIDYEQCRAWAKTPLEFLRRIDARSMEVTGLHIMRIYEKYQPDYRPEPIRAGLQDIHWKTQAECDPVKDVTEHLDRVRNQTGYQP